MKIYSKFNFGSDAITEVGRLGIQGGVKVAGGVVSGATGKILSDGIEISAGRRGMRLFINSLSLAQIKLILEVT